MNISSIPGIMCETDSCDYRDLMAHLGFEGMLPPVEAAAEPEQVMDPLNAMTIEQEAPDQALPEGDAEDFFNEEGQLSNSVVTCDLKLQAE